MKKPYLCGMLYKYSIWVFFWWCSTLFGMAQQRNSTTANFLPQDSTIAVFDTTTIDTIADPTAHLNPYYEPIVVPPLPQPLYHLYVWQAIYNDMKNNPPQDSLQQLTFPQSLDSIAQRIACDQYYYGMQYVGIDLQPVRPARLPTTLLFYVFLLIIFIFTLTRQFSDTYLERTFITISNFNLARQFFDEHNAPRNQIFNVLLGANWVLLVSVTIFLLLKYWHIPLSFDDTSLLLIVLAGVATYYTLRQLLLQILSFVLLPLGELIAFYRFNLTAINTLLVILLFPLMCVFAFSDRQSFMQYSLYAAMTVLIGVGIFALSRFWLISKDLFWQYQLHFWIYCCTFEIAPLLWLYKLTQQTW